MAVALLTTEQIRQMIPALHRQGSGHVILSDVYAIGLAYGVIRIFERRAGGRVVAEARSHPSRALDLVRRRPRRPPATPAILPR